MKVKKQQLEPDMEQQTGSNLGNKYIKAVYCHPAYLIYMLSTSCEAGLNEAQTGTFLKSWESRPPYLSLEKPV